MTGIWNNLNYHWMPATVPGVNPDYKWVIVIPYVNEFLNPFGGTIWLTDLNKRIGVAGLAVPGYDTSNPTSGNGALSDYGQRYQEFPAWIAWMRSTFNLPKPRLYGQCRGGLGALNLLCDYPDLFDTRIACLNPGCDLLSYPGSNAETWAGFGMTQAQFESTATQNQFSPNRKTAAATALRGVKEIHFWGGDSDNTIPYAQNGAMFAQASGADGTVVKGMDHVTYLNREIADFLCGDAVTFDQTYFEGHLTSPTLLQANTWTQVFVDADGTKPVYIHHDKNGNFNPNKGRFTAKEKGVHKVDLMIQFMTTTYQALPAGTQINVAVFKNGAPNSSPEVQSNASSMSWRMWLEAGDFIEVRAMTSIDAYPVAANFVTGWSVSK